MSMKKIIGSTAVVFTLMLGSCQPKDTDVSVTVTENVRATVPDATVQVNEGVVTLNGQVKDEASRMAAEDAAKKTKGVKSVINNITVMVPAEPTVTISTNGALEQGVNDAIKDFPGVTATVRDGEIIINGELAADKWKRLKMSLDALNPKKVNAVTLKINK